MATKNISITVIILVVSLCNMFSAQNKLDTMQTWIKGFSTWSRITVSDNGRWVLAQKLYHKNADSLMVFDVTRPGLPVSVVIRKNIKQSFLDEHFLYAKGNDNVEIQDLISQKKQNYYGFRKSDVMVSKKQFYLLGRDSVLHIYGTNCNSVDTIRNIKNLISDNISLLYLQNKNNEVVNAYNKEKVVYKSQLDIMGMEFSSSGKYLFLTEKENSGKVKLVVVNTNNDQVIQNDIGQSVADYIAVTETLDSKSLIVTFVKKEKRDTSEMLDVWYTNDLYLRQKRTGFDLRTNWILNLDSGYAKPLDSSYSNYIPLLDNRYFLAYDIREKNNYVYPSQYFDILIFDNVKKTFKGFCNDVRTMIFSKNRQYIIFFNEADKIWILYDIPKSEFYPIAEGKLSTPVFSADSNSVYFGGDNDLWIYSLSKKRLSQSRAFPGRRVHIVDPSELELNQFSGLGISVRYTSPDAMVLNIQDRENKKNAYYLYNKGKIKNVIPFSENRIKDFSYARGCKENFFTIEEDYNRYPRIYQYNDRISKRQLTNIPGFDSLKTIGIKREILKYKNSEGKIMEGILYYPIGFKMSKMYPVIVKIYQEQNTLRHHYLWPQIDEEGFNVRILLERGYFVFLPDTFVDDRGPGISALDCVHSGLDALKKYSFIDHAKIGLTGHSFGGYETNFIATHSNRFAAYLSGSGISNMITKYFTYNYPLQMPDYSRMEYAQYQMKMPFSENNELYILNNPLNNVQYVNAPILLWTGTKDENVSPDETMAFYIGLLRNRKPAIALFYHNKGHALGMSSLESLDLINRSLEWWDYFLKNKTTCEWIARLIKKDAH